MQRLLEGMAAVSPLYVKKFETDDVCDKCENDLKTCKVCKKDTKDGLSEYTVTMKITTDATQVEERGSVEVYFDDAWVCLDCIKVACIRRCRGD